MRVSIAVMMAVACVAGCSTRTETKVDADAWKIGDPSKHGEITVFPVLTSTRVDAPVAVTLDEAIAKGTCAVREQADGGEVNALEIFNSGDVPVYVLGGEIVQGGQQDRVIAEDLALAPGAKRTVPVFCVEQGRWSAGAPGTGGSNIGPAYFSASGVAAHPALRREAQVEKRQDAVWKQVAVANQAVGAGPSTGTYAAFLADSEGGGAASRAATTLESALQGADCIGFVTFVGGKPVSADVFASPAMFARYRNKLVRGAAAQAAVASKESGEATRTSAAEFLAAARRAPKKGTAEFAGRRRVEREDERVSVLEFGAEGGIDHLVALAK